MIIPILFFTSTRSVELPLPVKIEPMPGIFTDERPPTANELTGTRGYVDIAWAQNYNGPGDTLDIPSYMAIDNSGNILVTGRSFGNGTEEDYVTIKYFSNGDTAWVRRYNGPGNSTDHPYDVVVDDDGNVYITGNSMGSGTDGDFATIKYYPNGDTAWVRRYNSPYNAWDGAYAIGVDADGNVYVTGFSHNPSPPFGDYCTVKYSADGTYQWARRYDGTNNNTDDARGLTLDAQGNIYVAGYSSGAGTGYDYAVVKYYPNGNTAWARRYDGVGSQHDAAWPVQVDASGNVYVAGESGGNFFGDGNNDFLVVKYDSSGNYQWAASYNGPADTVDSIDDIVIDDFGNIYAVGYSTGIGTKTDYCLVKFLQTGDTAWTRRYDGPANWYDHPNDLHFDNLGNIIVTGFGYTSTYDIITIMYDPDGNPIWNKSYNAFNGFDAGHSVVVDKEGNIYISGQVESLGSYQDFTVIKYIPTSDVTSSDDAGIGTLRWAIQQANSSPNADSITFAFSDTILLQSALPTLYDNEIYILGSNSPGGKHSVVLDGTNLSDGNGMTINSSDNLVEGLVIANFPENGICVKGAASDNNTLSENLIFSNGQMAIDLNDDSLSLNDPDDLDTGPNEMLNYPEIDSVIMNPDSTFNIYGTAVDSAIIEIFMAHPAKDTTRPADGSGHGEAYSYIGSDTADENGDFGFTTGEYISFYSMLTCTAIDTLGNTSEFSENFMLAPSPLIIEAFSPVNLVVTDPDGYYIGRNAAGDLSQTLFPATYDDIDHDSVNIPNPIPGDYLIEIIGEEGAPPGSVYTIGITMDGSLACVPVYLADVPMAGAVDTLYQGIEEWGVYVNGDPSGNEAINLLDITYLINYLYKGGPPPIPEAAGDADCNMAINILDVTYLIYYLYKDGNPPCFIE